MEKTFPVLPSPFFQARFSCWDLGDFVGTSCNSCGILWNFGDVPSELGEPRSMGGMKGAPGKVWAGDKAQGTKPRRGLGKK